MDVIFAFFAGIWNKAFLGITWGHLILALIAFFIFFFIGKTIIFFFLRYLKRISEQSNDNIFDNEIYCALKRPLNFLVLVSAMFFFVDQLQLAGSVKFTADNLINSLMVICLYWFVVNLIRPFYFIFKDLERRLTRPMVDWMVRFIKILLVFVMVATVLQIWGIQIGPVIAGLGLFSVALALGAQDLFKNLIAGIVILAERRFVIGERVSAGSVDGTVERIGFRSTRIRTLDKIPVFVPNSIFSDQALTNYAGQTNRKINWPFGVVYGTTQRQLQNIVDQLKEYIKKVPDFIYTDNIVYVDSLADSAINILVNVEIISGDYGQFMRAKQNLIYKIMEVVEGNASNFAFPSQSLYVESAPKGSATFLFGVPDDVKQTEDSRGNVEPLGNNGPESNCNPAEADAAAENSNDTGDAEDDG